jgi:hypothetical protein
LIHKLKQTWQSEKNRPKYQIHISDTGEEMVSITHVVHTIKMSDVEDPDLFVAQPIKEQLTREPRELPQLWLNSNIHEINKFTMADMRLENYSPMDSIKAKMAV